LLFFFSKASFPQAYQNLQRQNVAQPQKEGLYISIFVLL